MADWKDRLLPASFRGIPFRVLSHEFSGGRNTKRHEMPDRDGGFNEDLGKKTDVFKIEAHVIGDNYFFIRDALIAAMKQKNEGVLIHPYFGVKLVQPEGISVKEDTNEGRRAFLTLEFGEAGSNLFPFAQIDAAIAFATSAATAIAQVQNGFQTAFVIAGLPAFIRDSAVSAILDLKDTFDSIFNNVRLNGTEHSDLKKKVEALGDNAATLVTDSAQLASEIDDIINGYRLLVPDAPESTTVDSTSGRDDKLAVFNDLIVFDSGEGDIPETTPTRTQEKNNAKALNSLVQQLSLVRLSQQTVDKEFKSNDEASAQRTSVIDNIEIQLKKTETSDESFQALEDLVAKLVQAVPDVNSNFANIKTTKQVNSIPTLVLAHDLYESVDNEQDIIDRNKIREPGFAVGDLEVLSR
jgi:prophage DNA circulation protein